MKKYKWENDRVNLSTERVLASLHKLSIKREVLKSKTTTICVNRSLLDIIKKLQLGMIYPKILFRLL